VVNGYKCISGGANNDVLRVYWTMTQVATGSASQMKPSDPSWWWQPTVVVTDDRPVVEVKTSGSTNWTSVALNADPDPIPGTPDVNEFDVRLSGLFTWQPDPQSPNQVVPNANNSQMGAFQGQATLPHTTGTLARAKATLHVTVSGTGDNVRVTAWRVGVDARLDTTARQ
jgi:hypothetical protein